jgi:hypothetical protein
VGRYVQIRKQDVLDLRVKILKTVGPIVWEKCKPVQRNKYLLPRRTPDKMLMKKRVQIHTTFIYNNLAIPPLGIGNLITQVVTY